MHWVSFTALTQLYFFFINIAAGSELCVAGVDYCNEENAVARVPAQDQDMLKRRQCQIMRPTVEEHVAQKVGICEE